MPLGNNNYGRHSSETIYKAIPAAGHTATQYATRICTGTGPLTWYHDQTPSGIADLCGNVWAWMGGIRTVYGELQFLANNNGADSAHSQDVSGAEWMAIKAADGSLISPDGSGTTAGSIKMDWVSNKLTYSTTITDASRGEHSATFANIVCSSDISDAAKLLLQDLGMLQYGTGELFSSHNNYFNNAQAERSFCSGGYYAYAAYGLATFGGLARSGSGGGIGFRAAFAKLPTA
jgi:hypothetical protein